MKQSRARVHPPLCGRLRHPGSTQFDLHHSFSFAIPDPHGNPPTPTRPQSHLRVRRAGEVTRVHFRGEAFGRAPLTAPHAEGRVEGATARLLPFAPTTASFPLDEQRTLPTPTTTTGTNGTPSFLPRTSTTCASLPIPAPPPPLSRHRPRSRTGTTSHAGPSAGGPYRAGYTPASSPATKGPAPRAPRR